MPSIEPYRDLELPERFLRWIETLRQSYRTIPTSTKSTGDPNGVISGIIGDQFIRTDGTAGVDIIWYKSTDGGDTGWIALG